MTLRAVLRGESLWLFLAAWALLGCFVHTRNQMTWNLQHAWVESLAERGTLHVGESATPVGSEPTVACVAETCGVKPLMPVTFTSFCALRSTTYASVLLG